MKLYKENGMLTEDGKYYLEQSYEINKLIDDAKDENEARLIGSLIAGYIGNKVSNKIANLKK